MTSLQRCELVHGGTRYKVGFLELSYLCGLRKPAHGQRRWDLGVQIGRYLDREWMQLEANEQEY